MKTILQRRVVQIPPQWYERLDRLPAFTNAWAHFLLLRVTQLILGSIFLHRASFPLLNQIFLKYICCSPISVKQTWAQTSVNNGISDFLHKQLNSFQYLSQRVHKTFLMCMTLQKQKKLLCWLANVERELHSWHWERCLYLNMPWNPLILLCRMLYIRIWYLVFHADQKYQKWTSIHGSRAWVQSRLLLGYFWDQEDCCSHSSQHPPPPWHWRWRELIQHLSGWWRAMWQLDECLTPSKSTTPAHMTHSHVYYQPPTGTPCGPWA